VKFGAVAIDDAVGAVLAHSLAHGGARLRKGTVLEASHVEALRRNGVARVIVARLEDDDVAEDEAAARIAAVLVGNGVHADAAFTGRSNLFADHAGVLAVNRAAIDALNRIDPGITFATLPEFAAVEAGRMVATVKIIPYAVPRAALDRALETIAGAGDLIAVHPYRLRRVGVVSTGLPGMKAKVHDKTLKVLADRLRPAGAEIVEERRVDHDPAAVAEAVRQLAPGADLLILFGASAVADRDDVLPAGIVATGGAVRHFGMPVDPGNLLLLADLDGMPVLGAPGCARSPRVNGFDWVLRRVLAGLAVSAEDITGMGVGGLLMEIVSRPQPRAGPPAPASARGNVAALVLAAGRSSRMGGPNKLLATLDGKPLVRHVVDAALGSAASSVTVVTGSRAEDVASLFEENEVEIVHNPNYTNGLSSSLATGIAAVPEDADAVVVLLGDMPRVTSDVIDRLIAAFNPEEGIHAVVPTSDGRRGNPVLWSRRFFDELRTITGDVGARHLIGRHADVVVEVEIGDAVTLDLDTPEALAAIGAELPVDGQETE